MASTAAAWNRTGSGAETDSGLLWHRQEQWPRARETHPSWSFLSLPAKRYRSAPCGWTTQRSFLDPSGARISSNRLRPKGLIGRNRIMRVPIHAEPVKLHPLLPHHLTIHTWSPAMALAATRRSTARSGPKAVRKPFFPVSALVMSKPIQFTRMAPGPSRSGSSSAQRRLPMCRTGLRLPVETVRRVCCNPHRSSVRNNRYRRCWECRASSGFV